MCILIGNVEHLCNRWDGHGQDHWRALVFPNLLGRIELRWQSWQRVRPTIESSWVRNFAGSKSDLTQKDA